MSLLVTLIWSIVTSATHIPHQVWVADITDVGALLGVGSTALITDVSSRTVVGVATRASMRTDALPLAGI